MSNKEKAIVITQHAKERMVKRGATTKEVTRTLEEGKREPAKRRK